MISESGDCHLPLGTAAILTVPPFCDPTLYRPAIVGTFLICKVAKDSNAYINYNDSGDG